MLLISFKFVKIYLKPISLSPPTSFAVEDSHVFFDIRLMEVIEESVSKLDLEAHFAGLVKTT